ncbi:hypothetical protein BGX30_007108 [Mortierella sp. GBA39]|nr:hypothetical protein BGX30_007108 [Mortierella sp. GBA39]
MTIIAGAFIFALDINLFVIPHDLGEGGVTGITIILYYLFAWSPGLVNLILNAILLIVGYKFLDKMTTVYTIVAVVFNSLFLHLTENWTLTSNEPIVNAIFGGVLAGVGIGLIVRAGGTTAGTVILARIAHKYWDWNISYALLFFDLIVAFSSYFIIGAESLMLTIIMLFVGTKHAEIAEKVNRVMDRGVTVFKGYGYYSKSAKEVLYIVISKQEVPVLKKIVKVADKQAFITIHDVRDVFGEGFIDISK